MKVRFRAMLLPAVLAGLVGCGGATTPQTAALPAGPTSPAAPTVTTARWSDATLWPSGRPPGAGDAVTLPAGKNVLLDVSPPRLASLTIPAGSALVFDDRELELHADWIMIHGRLEIGSEAKPFSSRATITLTDATPGENVMNMGDKVLGVMGGVLDLHGTPRLSWTRLAATATAGSDRLVLAEAPNWTRGDRLVLASTDYDHTQAETVVVESVSGPTVTLVEPLKHTHFGQVQTIAGRTLDQRAEVGLLTRNVRIQGETTSSTGGLGGQVMIMDGAQARFSNVELTRMGQKGQLRRYPIHYHMLGDAPTSYVKGSSLHGLFNRCLTIHGTNRLTVHDNVAYGTVGHCFFLEDGAEVGNVLTDNLALGTRNAAEGQALLPSDRGFPGASTFWITNPANTLRGNVAAGGDGIGFWYALPVNPTGLSKTSTVWPRRTPLGEFRDNVAHSYGAHGLNVDNGPREDGTLEAAWHDPRANPADPKSAPVQAVFENFVAYRNRDHGAWLRGRTTVLRNAVLADNAVGATFASSDTHLEGGLVVGESANKGTPTAWEISQGRVGADGRSLPKPWEPAFPIRGFQFYDGDVSARGVTFANFTPNATRQASGLAYLRHNAFPLSPRNAAEGLTFVNANRVYLEAPQADRDGDKSAVFVDRDGSVTGTAGRVVTASAPHLHDASCARRDDWNAHVCALPYGQLWLDDVHAGGAGQLTLTRTSDGASVVLAGSPGGRTFMSTSLPVGRAYDLRYQNAVPSRLRVGLNDRAPGDWVRLSLPVASEPFVYRDWWVDNRNRLKKVALAQLDATSGDSYAYENGVLHLRLVVKAGLDWAELEICRTDLCR